MKFKTDEQKEFNARMSLTIKILKKALAYRINCLCQVLKVHE